MKELCLRINIFLFFVFNSFQIHAINPRQLATLFCQVHEYCFNLKLCPGGRPSAANFIESTVNFIRDDIIFFKTFGFWRDIEGYKILEKAFQSFEDIQVILDTNPPKDALFKGPIVSPNAFALEIATKLLIDTSYDSKKDACCLWPNIEEHPFNLSKRSIEKILKEYAKRLKVQVNKINLGKITLPKSPTLATADEKHPIIPKRVPRTFKFEDIAGLSDDKES